MASRRSGNAVTTIKRTGAHYTPAELARFVAQRIAGVAFLDSLESIRVFDPACGDGELLVALVDSLPAHVLSKTTLSGVEFDQSALRNARGRLEKLPLKSLDLREADFLTLVNEQQRQRGLFDVAPLDDIIIQPANIIIANPPYVRTQVLGAKKAQELAASFGLSGRVDLYHAFLIAMTRCLVPGGILGVITSNRFLSTKGGSAVREFLDREYDIIEIVDLGDTKLFEAAVLPAIFVGKKRTQRDHNLSQPIVQPARFARIYELSNGHLQPHEEVVHAGSVYDALAMMQDSRYHIAGRFFEMTTGALSVPALSSETWGMVTSIEEDWLQSVNDHARFRIRDIAKVRVGIKTCADEVFIRADWQTIPQEKRPEPQLLHCLLSHDDAARWIARTPREQCRQIIYTHEMREGKRKAIDLATYPGAAAYFEMHRARLENREYVLRARRQWFEIWVPQQPDAWRLPKMLFPDISAEPKFFFDDHGCMVDGNCYWITMEANHDPDTLFFIQGLANSNLMTRYHDLSFNNKLYAGRRRYLTQYVEKYPVPNPDLADSRRVISLVKELVFGSLPKDVQTRKEREIEVTVARLFGVDPVLRL